MRLSNALPAILSLVLAVPAVADVAEGEGLYMTHCATCHGADATGNGPMAPVLTIQPVDLTALTAISAGEYPAARIAGRIDGRDPLVSHGSPMPVYGSFFEGTPVTYRLPNAQTMMTSQPIVDLLEYIETLQK